MSNEFLVEKSPTAAQRAMRAILDAAEQLRAHPEVGRPLGDGRRDWFAPFGAGAYVLRYRCDAEGPAVIRVWHSREDRR